VSAATWPQSSHYKCHKFRSPQALRPSLNDGRAWRIRGKASP